MEAKLAAESRKAAAAQVEAAEQRARELQDAAEEAYAELEAAREDAETAGSTAAARSVSQTLLL